MNSKRYTMRPVNFSFISGLSLTLILLASISCYYAYSYEMRGTLLRLDTALKDVYEAYQDNVYSLSSVYEPIFADEYSRALVHAYYSRVGDEPFDAMRRPALVELLESMMVRDNDVEWIALYNPNARYNYYMGRGDGQLNALPASFPYVQFSDSGRYKLRGTLEWEDARGAIRSSYVIQGGALPSDQAGSVFVGYSYYALNRIVDRLSPSGTVSFLVTAGGEVVYDSDGTRYGTSDSMDWMGDGQGVRQDGAGKRWYTGIIRNSGRDFAVSYRIPWSELFWQANANAGRILAILVCFALFALGFYVLSSRRIVRRVTSIREGLLRIGGGGLNFRLALSSKSDEFDEISESINTMAVLLQESVEKEYEMRLKQMQLQLNQIQARFNPHFLYNTLEIIRGRLFATGDIETADFIEKLSRIFRKLTDAHTVVTVRDEISFCSLYLALLQLRYSDAVNVSYDVAPELQDMGILANLVQPAIENYFVHALDVAAENNALEITCLPVGENAMQIVVANNGMGVSAERIEAINAQLSAPSEGWKGYGLQSIATRIRLFYGESYGVQLLQNAGGGVKTIITIPCMSLEEHEKRLLRSQAQR